MEIKTLYAQLRHVITVKIYDKRKSYYDYKYIDEIREEKRYVKWYHRLIFKKTSIKTHYKGYYEDYYGNGFNKWHTLHSAQDLIDKDYLVDDVEKIVYDKPFVEFRFSNKDMYTKKFNTMQELEAFVQPLVNKNKDLIKIL